MKIIIIGAGGFIGSYLTNELTSAHQVLPIYKDSIDLYNVETVKLLLEKVAPDVIINCLTLGEKRNDSADVGRNLSLFYNFYSNKHLFKHYINIGSGIETTNSNTPYAFSKKAINNIINNESNTSKFISLRLFGCFGNTENESRLLKKFLASKETFNIVNDRLFDYISIQDFYNIVKYTLTNFNYIKTLTDITSKVSGDRSIDCVYADKLTISDFLSYFCEINNIEKNFIVESSIEERYIGQCNTILSLRNQYGLRLYGMAHGLKVYV
jgi:nucleoside-diphosphate-sugar epimerase